MNLNKAAQVHQVYDDARYSLDSEGCYDLAIYKAETLGGIEVTNSTSNRSESFAPTRTFEFADSSSAQVTYGGVFVVAPNALTNKGTEIITLNIGLDVSKNYMPDGVGQMQMQYEYVKDALEQTIGAPIYIGLTQSTTEKTVVVQYTNVQDVLKKLYWLAWELKQDCIAYRVQDGDFIIGGALVGEYAHEWNHGVFNENYFIEAPWKVHFHAGSTL